MKLGINPIPDLDWRQKDWIASTQRWRSMGFKSATVFIHKPLESQPDDLLPVKQALAAAGLAVNQANGWHECLVNPDPAARAEGIKGMQSLCRYGAYLEAHSVYIRPGSLNPNGHWWAHPENHSAETFDRLVDSVRQVCRAAEREGVKVAIEGHVLTVLDTPSRVRDLLDAVASPALKFNLDPVNFIGTVRDVHDTSRIINDLFDLLGQDTIVAHAKDCRLAEAFVMQIHEVVIGTGTLDYRLFLRRFMDVCPDGDFIIEHLPEEKIPQAREALCRIAERLNIVFDSSDDFSR
jgi:sugar phosphate isomerase/epimerase